MAFADFTKQIAVQALGDALESKPAKAAVPETVCATMLAQVQAMQRALKEDEELVVLFHTGAERVRVFEFFVPSPQVLVMSGVDTAKNTARVVAAAESLQLVCKIVKVPSPAKPARISFVAPKPPA